MKKKLKNNLVVPRILVSNFPLRTCILILASFSLTACSGSSSNEDATTGTNTPVLVTENPIPEVVSPTANFDTLPERTEEQVITAKLPVTVQFKDLSENGSEAITNWLWDFGDGSDISMERNPSHEYKSAGTFTVKLNVSNSVDSNEFISIVKIEEQLDRIVTLNELPVPDANGIFPDYGKELLQPGEFVLKQFNPIVTTLNITKWRGYSSLDECDKGYGLKTFTKDKGKEMKTYFRTKIPTTQPNFSVFNNFQNDGVAGIGKGFPKIPGKLVLIGTQTASQKSFDYTGEIDIIKKGVVKKTGRWEGCYRDRGEGTTRYDISHSIKIKHVPVLRHYKVWKKISSRNLNPGDSTLVKTEEVAALEQSTTENFEASLTVSVAAGIGSVSASVTGEIAQAYETSVAASSSTLLSEEYTVDTSEYPGYGMYLSDWVLMDRFRVEGQSTPGVEWSDENYILAPGQLFLETGAKDVRRTQKVWYLPR